MGNVSADKVDRRSHGKYRPSDGNGNGTNSNSTDVSTSTVKRCLMIERFIFLVFFSDTRRTATEWTRNIGLGIRGNYNKYV